MFLFNLYDYYFNFLYSLNFNNYFIDYHQGISYYNFIFNGGLLNIGIFKNFYSSGLRYSLTSYFLNYSYLFGGILVSQKNLVLIYFFIYFFTFIRFYTNSLLMFNIISYFYSILAEFEREVGSIDDLSYIIIMFIVFFFLSLIFVGSFIFLFKYNLLLFSILLNIKLILIFIPFFFILDLGFFFLIYLRGSSRSSSFLYEVFQDYLYIISYLFRVAVQFIRILFYFFFFKYY